MQFEYKATGKQNLQQHVQLVHNGVKSDCVHCDYKATEKENLWQHVQSVHIGILYIMWL